MAADPTYPLLSVFALLSAALLFSLLATSVIRQSWSLGVTFLAFWLFWENLFLAVNSIIWSNSTEIRLYAFCDIVSHLYMFTYIVKPACTLIITRRLYKIASLRSFIPASHQTRAVDAVIEWSLGLGLPVLMTSIFYYIVQGNRFQVLERLGCDNAVLVSGVEILLIDTPGLILPSISLLFYCPKIVYVFYRHSRDTNKFLQTNGSISRGGYSRILILGCLDIFLTLPVGVMQLVSDIKFASPLPWYQGWDYTHSDWDPISYSWNDLEEGGPWAIFTLYFSLWSSVILALAIFALFGLTVESRAAYSRMMFSILRLFGRTPLEHKHGDMNELQFRIRSLVASEQTQTQQSAFVAFQERRYASEDAEQGHRSNTTSGSGESKAIGATIRSGSPTIGTMPIFQAEDGQFSRKSEKRVLLLSNIEDGGVHAEHANNDLEKAKVDAPHFEGLWEDSRGTQFVCLQSFVEAADTT